LYVTDKDSMSINICKDAVLSNSSNKQNASSFLSSLFIGGTAGAVSRTLTAPLELYKLQRQNPYIKHTTLREVVKLEGIPGLWKGNLVNIYRIFPQMSISYCIYHNVKTTKYIKSIYHYNPDLGHLVSGTLGGLVATTCVYPLETIRSRLSLQTNNEHYAGIYDTFRKMSYRDLYRGLSVGLMGFVPFNALNFMFYHRTKSDLQGILQPGVVTHMICGGLAGVLSVSITYPTDVVRRRLHLQGFDNVVPYFSSIPECIAYIYKTEGVRGFYRGLFACYLKLFPAVGIQFTTVEYLRGLL
jgi:solute carrier family 25 phosphate transporter 23/24/25/41